MIDYGSDVSTYADGDLDPTFSPTLSGVALVSESVARIFETVQGMFDDAPDVGGGVGLYLSAPVRSAAAIASNLKQQAETDERVLSCEVSTRIVDDVLSINADGVTSDNAPFRLVLKVGEFNGLTELVR